MTIAFTDRARKTLWEFGRGGVPGGGEREQRLPAELLHHQPFFSLGFIYFFSEINESGKIDRKQLKTQLSFFFLLNWRTFEWTYESDCLRWCLWWACIESRLAERITGMQLGWLVRRQLLFGVRTQRETGMVKVSDPKIFFCTPDSYPSLICRPTYTDSAIMESDLKLTNIIKNFFCRHSLLSNAVNFWNMQSLTAEALGFLGGLILGNSLKTDAHNASQLVCLSSCSLVRLCQFVCQRILGSQKWCANLPSKGNSLQTAADIGWHVWIASVCF